MALLGTSANRQCNGYFPGYHSARDLVFGAEGSWTSSNGNSGRKNDCYQIGSFPLSSSCHLVGYKELLKQTILKHEAIFRDQIHELHRIYQKQRELMDEIKRIELHKYSLRLETSSSSSSLYYSQNLPWLTSQSSVLNAEGTRFPLASMQEKGRQLFPTPPAPTAIKESLEDPKLSGLTYRKAAKKILDLQLPATEYIDGEGYSCENGRVIIKEPPLSTYTSNGFSKGVYNTDEKPYGTNSNGFADLNLPFELEEGKGVESDDFGASIHHRNYTFHDIPGKMTLGSQNLSNNAILNLTRKQNIEGCSDLQLPNHWEKHGQLPSGISAGKNSADLGSLPIFNDMESQSVSIESVSKKLKQVNNCPCFDSMQKLVPGSMAESHSGTHDLPSGGWLGPGYASLTCSPHKLISESDMRSSGISPSVIRKSIALGLNLDYQNYLFRSSFCSRSNLLDLQSISTDDLNSCDNCGSSSAGHELSEYVKDSEFVGNHNNLNLNIIPAAYSDITAAAFQSIQNMGEVDKCQDSGLPWFKAKPVAKGTPNDESQTSTHIEKSDLCRDKTLAFDLNGKPQISKVFQSLSKNHFIEDMKMISNVNSLCDSDPDMGKQAPASEHFMKNEKKHKHLAGILDLNSCSNDEESMPIDIDLQAPASPENKECSPPRGESDENQHEMMPSLLSRQEQEDVEAREEQARIAAEALVSISEAVANNGLQMTTCLSSDSFVSSPLHWFAGIISTIVDHSESEVKVDFNCTIKYLEDFLPSDFDYFEFMSLNLTETKDLHYCCYKSSSQNEEEGKCPLLTQQTNCRTNRRRRGNNFQSEILPSLVSLSRYEVNEDLQTIGALVEAAGTHSATGCQRNAGRNALARGKRKSCASPSNITDFLLNMNINTEIGIEKRGFINWGKICRKPRGKRFPSSKPHFIFSQVHN